MIKTKYDIVLINPSYNRRKYSGIIYPLGLGYLSAAVTTAGFSVKIIDCALYFKSLDYFSVDNLKKWIQSQLLYNIPNIAIGIGPCTTPAVRSIKAISEVCKEFHNDLPLIYGGPLASIPSQTDLFFSEFSADIVVSGDGEDALCEILRALHYNKSIDLIEGVSTKFHYTNKPRTNNDLDKILFPIRPSSNGLDQYIPSTRRNFFLKPFATMVSSRGCPYSCPYCVSNIIRNGKYHRRSWHNIFLEIKELVMNQNTRSIIFYDDAFFPSPDTLENDIIDFSELLIPLKCSFSWQVEMRPNVLLALDKTLIKTLYLSGCRQINIGIEKSRSSDLKYFNKTLSPDALRIKLNQLKNFVPEIKFTGTFILGGPDESIGSIEDIINYSISLGILFAHYYPLELYPGTKFYDDLYGERDRLWWYKNIISDDMEWGEIIYENDMLDRNALLYYVSLAYQRFYKRPSWHTFAKSYFGENLKVVEKQIVSWFDNRFRITLGKKVQ